MLCNYFKSVAGRATKSLTWPNITDEKSSSSVSTRSRYERYSNVFEKYPQMHVDYTYFEKSLRKIEKSVRKSTSGKMNIGQLYSLSTWEALTEEKKFEHSARDCTPCKCNIVF